MRVGRGSAAASRPSYVALCGGVGGAKLALGLAHVLAPDQLAIIVNTGDDFEHVGLHISPDIDTVLYTLAGLANPEAGWGLAGETWEFMAALERLGGPGWFRLGDGDLATHVVRTERLKRGETLSQIAEHLSRRLGVGPRVVPMCDQPLRSILETDQGRLPFQVYFVARRCEPAVRGISFEGAAAARPAPEAAAALAASGLGGIIICPSNPWLSIDPILAVPGMKAAIRASGAPVIALTPIIGGKAVKGPTVKIMRELGLTPDAVSIAAHYRGLIDGFVLDEADIKDRDRIGLPLAVANTLMRSLADRVALASTAIAFCESLRADTTAASGNPA